jgi:hypothetical protein
VSPSTQPVLIKVDHEGRISHRGIRLVRTDNSHPFFRKVSLRDELQTLRAMKAACHEIMRPPSAFIELQGEHLD